MIVRHGIEFVNVVVVVVVLVTGLVFLSCKPSVMTEMIRTLTQQDVDNTMLPLTVSLPTTRLFKMYLFTNMYQVLALHKN